MNIKFKNGIRLAMLIFSILTILASMIFGYGRLYEKVMMIEKKVSVYENHLSHIQEDISAVKTDIKGLKENVNYFIRQFLIKGIGG